MKNSGAVSGENHFANHVENTGLQAQHRVLLPQFNKLDEQKYQLNQHKQSHQSAGSNCLLPTGKLLLKESFEDFLLRDKNLPDDQKAPGQDKPTLYRLSVKNGEYIYARPNDIIMIESCDHLVKVHLAIDTNVKKAVRNNTLKDFLLQLPQHQFTRIGRFCAVNIARLSGGNCKEQTFEFDFKISVKLKRAISQSYFTAIGR